MEEGSISEVILWYTDKEKSPKLFGIVLNIEAPQGVLLMDEVTRLGGKIRADHLVM